MEKTTPLHVHGLGVTGAFGAGVDALRQGLGGNLPRPGEAVLQGAGSGLRQEVLQAETSPLEAFVPKRSLRRLDRLSRLALLGGHLCLQDAHVSGAELEHAGLILATGYGATATTFAFLDSCMDDGDALASPTHFSHSVHNAAVAHLAIQLGIQGPCCTVSQFGQSFASALSTARAWLHEDRVDTVLLGVTDEICDVLAYCHARFCGEKQNAPLPGEGAAFYLLRAVPAVDQVPVRIGHASLCGDSFTPDEEWCIREAALAFRMPAAEGPAAPSPRLASHGRLYGTMPCSQGLDAAVAVLCQRDGLFYNSTGSNSGAAALPPGQGIACLHRERAASSLVMVEKM